MSISFDRFLRFRIKSCTVLRILRFLGEISNKSLTESLNLYDSPSSEEALLIRLVLDNSPTAEEISSIDLRVLFYLHQLMQPVSDDHPVIQLNRLIFGWVLS